MTQEIFLQLLKDSSKGKDVFARFLQKNHSIFEQTIGIRFSGDKYLDIDVNHIYYENLMDYAIHSLEQAKQSAPFNDWVTKLAMDRANYIRPSVNRSLTKLLLEKGGKENWDNACELIGTEYIALVKRVVYKYFDNVKYRGYMEDVTNSFLTIFYLDRADSPGPIKTIENLDSYLYQMLANLAKKKKTRTQIDEELGLDHDDTEIDKFDVSKDDEFDMDGAALPSEDSSDNLKIDLFLHIDGQDDHADQVWAENEIEKLLRLVPDKEADLIRKIMLRGYEYDELALEEKHSVAYMYTRVSRAMVSLMRVSLPYIKTRSKKIYAQNICHMHDEYHKDILDAFFADDRSIEDLSIQYGKKTKKIANDLSKAFDAIKKINNENKIGYVLDDEVADYQRNEIRQDAEKTMKKYQYKF